MLHPLLGLTWIFAFLSIDPEFTLIFTYLFTICNSLQGVMFFVFHCFTNSEVGPFKVHVVSQVVSNNRIVHLELRKRNKKNGQSSKFVHR